ncbi:MAG TPA: SDR family oxidoreductase [Verrucomicrobiae bacterium]|nr:SDR family oxidoreductase [Verrucomicrobiae bacterium]
MNKASSETVLITGASSGIGLELAKCFAADSCRLILVARNQKALEDLAQELRQKNKIEVIVLPADLSLPETPKRIFSELSAQKISVDVLVNNAGFGLHSAFVESSLQKQLEMLQVNIAALTELTGLFLPAMIKNGRGGILNVGSVAGFLPGPNMAVYYATKAFVQSFTEALAEELSGTNLTISVLCPGPTESNFGNVARGGKSRQIKTAKMLAETVARYGHCAFRAGKIVAIPGLKNRLSVFLIRFIPRRLVRKMVKTYNTMKD